LSAREAAVKVLREAGEPLGAGEITRRILERGLWSTAGATPQATVRAVLGEDVRRHGDDSTFVRVKPGVFALRGQPQAPPAGTYSFTESAIKVLNECADKRPMYYRDITATAVERGWLQTEGKTPEMTMYSQVISEIKRYKNRGEQPRFVKHGKGYFGLSRWMGEGLAFQIEQHNRGVHEALRQRLHEIDPGEFEELVGRLLAEVGFEDIEVTSRSSDGGIDVRGTLVVGDVIRTRMAVQVKRWRKNVQAQTVQQVRGSLGTHEQGLIVTTSDFSEGAREEAERPDAVPVALMNGEQLVALLVENEIHVTRIAHDIIELDLGEEDESC
jgi:restriction system protein